MIKKNNKIDFFEKLIIKLNAPTLKEKTNFFRLLAVAQNAGLGIRDALISIGKSETNKGFKIIIQDLIEQLTQGINLASAMKSHDYIFGKDEIALVNAAETMGNLPDVLNDISDELENFQQIKQKIKKAITYPIILIVLSIIAVVILLIFVIPTIIDMFPNKDSLPEITKFMLQMSGFLKHTRYLILIGILGSVLTYKFLYQYVLPFKIIIDKLNITIPVISNVTKTYYMYRFSKLLGQFFNAGVSTVLSLKLISEIFKNFLYKKKIIEIQKDLETGFDFYDSMQGSNLFDPILVQIIHVGEDTGNTGDILIKIAEYYRLELRNKIDILMGMIEPMLMLFIAVIIGLIVGSIFLPMADLVNVIQ